MLEIEDIILDFLIVMNHFEDFVKTKRRHDLGYLFDNYKPCHNLWGQEIFQVKWNYFECSLIGLILDFAIQMFFL